MSTEKMYMNTATGSVGPYHSWWYVQDGEDCPPGVDVNAVDLGEVVEVIPDGDGGWIEAE